MFKRLFSRWVLMDEAAGAGGGGAPAAAPAAATATEAAPTFAAAEVPESLLGEKPAPVDGTKPADGEKPADGTKPAEEAKPIEYEFKLPEGVKLDDTKLGEFKAIAAEAKLGPEAAQKMVDMYVAEIKQAQEAPLKAWTELQTAWRDEVKNDPVIGGANLDKNLAATKAGLNNLLGEDAPKFFHALNITGAGNNPDIVRGLLKAAAPHAPASPVSGSPGAGQKSPGATLYPKQAGLGNGHEG